MVGLLNATQIVFVGDTLGIKGIPTFAVSVPQVHSAARQRGFVVREVVDRHGDAERYALGLGRTRSEARGDVAAYNATLGQHIRPIGAVARIWAGCFLWYLAVGCVAGLGGLSGVAIRRAGLERDQAGPSKAGASYQLEHAAPVQQTWQIVVEAAIMVLQVFFSVVAQHHDQLFRGSEGA